MKKQFSLIKYVVLVTVFALPVLVSCTRHLYTTYGITFKVNGDSITTLYLPEKITTESLYDIDLILEATDSILTKNQKP